MDRNDQTKATYEIGRKLVDLCRKGKNVEAVNTLYSPDVVSIEVRGDEKMPARMEGIDAVRGKNQWWVENHTIHSADADGPYPHGERSSSTFATTSPPPPAPWRASA